MRIVYSAKSDLYPAFGSADVESQIACVREDLPKLVKDFVAAHELYHLKDKAHWWVWREIKANAAGALKHPIGFAACVLMSTRPYRLKYYWKRIAGREMLATGEREWHETIDSFRGVLVFSHQHLWRDAGLEDFKGGGGFSSYKWREKDTARCGP